MGRPRRRPLLQLLVGLHDKRLQRIYNLIARYMKGGHAAEMRIDV